MQNMLQKVLQGREKFFRAIAGKAGGEGVRFLESFSPYFFRIFAEYNTINPPKEQQKEYVCIFARYGAKQTAAQATAYARHFGRLPAFVYVMAAELPLQENRFALFALDSCGRIWRRYLEN